MDTAWLAGVFEGEGCIAFTGKNSVNISISMTDKDVVERCRNVMEVGAVLGPYRLAKRGHKPIWTWRVGNQDEVRQVLTAIQPWLGSRRLDRAQAALTRLEQLRRHGSCKRGHEMAGTNLYTSPGGQKQCRACLRMREANRYRKPLMVD